MGDWIWEQVEAFQAQMGKGGSYQEDANAGTAVGGQSGGFLLLKRPKLDREWPTADGSGALKRGDGGFRGCLCLASRLAKAPSRG